MTSCEHFDASTRPEAPGRITAFVVARFVACCWVLLVAGLMVVQFSYTLWIDHRLGEAAEAAVHEAISRPSTRTTIERTIRQAFSSTRAHRDPVAIELTVNGQNEVLHPLFQAKRGDYLAVTVSMQTRAIVPDVLRSCGFPASPSVLRARRTAIIR